MNPNPLDRTDLLEEALSAHFDKKIVESNDDWNPVALHASDNTNCVRRIWYRRNGHVETFPGLGFSMHRGKLFELIIAQALEAIEAGVCKNITDLGFWYYGANARHGALLYSAEHIVSRFRARLISQYDIVNRYELDIHPDILRYSGTAITHVYEIKSMRFCDPKIPQFKNVIQAGTYALWATEMNLAEDAPPPLTFVIETDGTKIYAHRVNLEEVIPIVKDRIIARMFATTPGSPLPEPVMPDEQFKIDKKTGAKHSILCGGYCGFKQCEYHAAHTEPSVPGVQEAGTASAATTGESIY